MATFGELKSRVAARLIDPSSTAVSLSDIAQVINESINFWKFKRFFFNDEQTTLTMEANDPYVVRTGDTVSGFTPPTLPSNFLYEIEKNGFVIQYNNLSYVIKKVHPETYDFQNSRGKGLPFIYTYRNDRYEFYYYPNLAYSLDVNYIRDYDVLTQDSDTNDFTTYAETLILYDTLARVSEDFRQDEVRASRFRAKADEEYENLKTRSFEQIKTGELVTENIL